MTKDSSFVSYHIIGDAFVDLFCFVEGNLPELGGDSRLSLPVKSMAGGSATNSATHLKALLNSDSFWKKDKDTDTSEDPSEVNLYSTVNPNDDYGKLMLNHAQQHGYNFSNCNKDGNEASTGHCLVVVCQGDRSFMTHPGCVQDFHASDVHYETIISDSSNHIHLHVAGYYNIEGFWHGKLKEKIDSVRAERKRRHPESTVSISLVPQHDATGVWDGGLSELLPLLNFAIMNDVEAQHIAKGSSIEYWSDFCKQHCANTWVIVTHGKEGAIAIRNGEVHARQAAVAVDPVDPTGAGDSFISGFLYGTWEWLKENNASGEDGWPVEAVQQGLLWGCSVATCSVLTRGASVPSSAADIQSFVNQTQDL